uniref:Uncharacterized protein n=1 Tax=Leersia perrieri TaxID=77586 RepID=A0A0D9X4G5_9ORYZ
MTAIDRSINESCKNTWSGHSYREIHSNLDLFGCYTTGCCSWRRILFCNKVVVTVRGKMWSLEHYN